MVIGPRQALAKWALVALDNLISMEAARPKWKQVIRFPYFWVRRDGLRRIVKQAQREGLL